MKDNLKLIKKHLAVEGSASWNLKKAIEGFEKELREYVNFVDGLRSHSKPKEMMIKYKVYKEILGEKEV